MKLAANISLMYTEWPFADRILAAAQDGFEAIECMFPYELAEAELRRLADDQNLRWALINAPAGDWAGGDRGLACHRHRVDEFRRAADQAIRYANALGVNRVHVLAGAIDPAGHGGDAEQAAWDSYLENLNWLTGQTRDEPIVWLVEPINRRDVPGYLLSLQEQAHRVVETLNMPNLGVQMDLYHCQIAQGDVLTRLKTFLPSGRVKHIQIAGVPERHEPDFSELDYGRVFDALRECAYAGFIGCEYRPKTSTRAGLGWTRLAPFSGTMRASV